ncbi:hypothetical protein AWC38_SpisGene7413 [Stylophora pistillata]|uniref:DED domain-containing protein n=1 Tax=Stylophora pistillata TaxID=50429 RepID=A0A2B4SB18_STYPI|nr:hypothetical protein AWC38_SpisGene7413 [Stylophora pistillata]
MLEDLKRRYRVVLLKISLALTEEERKQLLFYGKDYFPKSFASPLPAVVEIFDRLEDAEAISLWKLDILTEFAVAINRPDLVNELAGFELTRELVMRALKWHGSQPSMNSSTESVGLHLAEMVDHVQDRVDFPTQGLIKFLLTSQTKASDVLDVVCREALPDDDVTKPNSLALLVAIASEIVLLVFDENQQENHRKKYAVAVAIELADHLLTKVANFGSWEAYLPEDASCGLCEGDNATVRCQDCGHRQFFCRPCAIALHQDRNIFHSLEVLEVCIPPMTKKTDFCKDFNHCVLFYCTSSQIMATVQAFLYFEYQPFGINQDFSLSFHREYRYFKYQTTYLVKQFPQLYNGATCPLSPKEEGVLIQCMDACFGLSRKKAQGKQLSEANHNNVLYADQDDMDDFVEQCHGDCQSSEPNFLLSVGVEKDMPASEHKTPSQGGCNVRYCLYSANTSEGPALKTKLLRAMDLHQITSDDLDEAMKSLPYLELLWDEKYVDLLTQKLSLRNAEKQATSIEDNASLKKKIERRNFAVI